MRSARVDLGRAARNRGHRLGSWSKTPSMSTLCRVAAALCQFQLRLGVGLHCIIILLVKSHVGRGWLAPVPWNNPSCAGGYRGTQRHRRPAVQFVPRLIKAWPVNLGVRRGDRCMRWMDGPFACIAGSGGMHIQKGLLLFSIGRLVIDMHNLSLALPDHD